MKKINLKLSTPKTIGLVLMVLAFATMLIAVPVTDYLGRSEEVTVIVATQDLNANSEITENLVKKVQIPKSELTNQFIVSLEEIIGKYTSSSVLANEPISKKRITSAPVYKDYFLRELPANKLAISVTIVNMAASVSGKIQPNDIVTVFACPPNNDAVSMAVQPTELMYVKVLDVVTATQEGTADDDSDTAAPQLSTVTLLADTRQAGILAYFDRTSPVHLALAFRGDIAQADKLLQQQESSLQMLAEAEESEEK